MCLVMLCSVDSTRTPALFQRETEEYKFGGEERYVVGDWEE